MDKQKGRGRFIAMCVLPAVLLFFVFMILPTFNIFRMSLYKWGGFSSRRTFVGFENFTKLFRDMKFLQSVENTLLLIVVVSVITMSLAIIFAAFCPAKRSRGKLLSRGVLYSQHSLHRHHQRHILRHL